MRNLSILALSLFVVLSAPFTPSLAQQLAQADAKTGTAEGEVRKVDKPSKKVTVRHGPISGLDMDAMTMVFQVADPAMLDKLNVGDKIKFTVRQGGGAMTIQSYEPVK